jgi:membrane-bound metal-dependent hydrolase YbcI (DUF457 family)
MPDWEERKRDHRSALASFAVHFLFYFTAPYLLFAFFLMDGLVGLVLLTLGAVAIVIAIGVVVREALRGEENG